MGAHGAYIGIAAGAEQAERQAAVLPWAPRHRHGPPAPHREPRPVHNAHLDLEILNIAVFVCLGFKNTKHCNRLTSQVLGCNTTWPYDGNWLAIGDGIDWRVQALVRQRTSS